MLNNLSSIQRTGLLLLGIGIVTIFICPGYAQEDDTVRVIEVVGSGTIHDNDRAAAREQAIANALISAVGRISVELLPIQSQVQNFKTFNEQLYDQTDNYVQDYKVLTEFMSGNNYRTMVQATVMIEKIREQLLNSGLIIEEKVMPKILFFVAEYGLEAVLPNFWWGEDLVFVIPSSEDAMSQVLREKGFAIINHGAMVEPVNYNLDVTIQDTITLGTHLVADIVIIGTARAEKTTNVMGGSIKSFKGTIHVKAYHTKTGAEIAFAAMTAVSTSEDDDEGGRQSLYNAGILVGQELAKQITSAWESETKKRAMVEIVVHGTSELTNFIAFRKALGKIPGVTGIHIKEMKADDSTITVDYDGTAKSLADELMLKTFESFGIDIYEVSPGRLSIELISG